MTADIQVKLAPSTTLTETEGKVVLFSKKTGDFFGLNESAAYLIRQLLESDFSSTIDRASKTFAVPAEELRKDLHELVGELVGLGLLEPKTPA